MVAKQLNLEKLL